MRPAERLALAIILGLAVVTCGTAAAAAYTWHHAGSVRFAMHDSRPDGVNLAVSLPGALVNAAIAFCPIPVDFRTDPRWQGMLPALHDVADRLASMPDAVIMDVNDHGDHVRITKTGGELVLRVLSPDERFEIAVPIDSVKRLVARFEANSAA